MIGQVWAASPPFPVVETKVQPPRSPRDRAALAAGELLLTTRSHGLTGGQASITLAFAPRPVDVWAQLTDYPRWVDYLPDLTQSEILPAAAKGQTRLRQVGRKSILGFTAEAALDLQVQALAPYRLRFDLERGGLAEFTATFTLTPWRQGTLVNFTGQATPLFPIPGWVVEQVMRHGLPMNLRHMRQVIERSTATAA